MSKLKSSSSSDYAAWLQTLKETIRHARIKASLAVNRELILLYWHIGREILKRQKSEGWGTKVIQQLANDLRSEFPDMTGLSRTNLMYMRAFADAWPEESIVQQLVGQIPWGHNVRLLELVSDRSTREWYTRATIEHGWSRSVLEMQIEHETHSRVGAAQTNFSRTLAAPYSDLARDLIKDPYVFDFLGLTDATHERAIEKALITHLRDFLLELGVGFAFVGNQYRLDVEGDEFFIDLLFYHLKLHCYVVFELKNSAFKPEHMGQLNFYLAAIDAQVRDPKHDAPTIGILLCKTKKKTIVEYALRGIETPMGVSTYRTSPKLPNELVGLLPTLEQLEEQLRNNDDIQPDVL
jgi:predicted nuclease of restriction endonuclease-like (RecB) superfamily